MSKSIVVATDGLTKVFRDFWHRPKVRAVDDLTIQIGEGSIYGLLGPNGSGKSTTIKMLLGLLHPTAGQVSVLGKSPRDIAAKRDIGYLPEASYLYNYLSSRETLDFYGRLFDLSAVERRERVDQLLEMVGLTHVEDRPVGEFSKGMARRVGLAQALLNDPKLVLLDEPTSGLDPTGCRQVKDLILSLARRGKTILLSSHLLADVEDVCDEIAILYSGRIRAQGRTRELLRKQDRLHLTVPSLPQEQLAKVLQLLRKKLSVEPTVEHPSMSLETFFLDVVAEAVRDGGTVSGATSADGVAAFLGGGDTVAAANEADA